LAKAIATIATFPLIRAKAVINTWSKMHDGEPAPPLSTVLKSLVEEKGLAGLYTGVEAQLSKGLLNAALMLMLKERIDEIVLALLKR
jgi:solute carrier family 25 (peroxisomal adenine nucleotide transporter), member 17